MLFDSYMKQLRKYADKVGRELDEEAVIRDRWEEFCALFYPEFTEFLKNEGKLPDAFKFTPNPFEDELEYVGPDGLDDHSGVSCWLSLVKDIDINEAVRLCSEWKKIHLEFYKTCKIYNIPEENCSKKVVILLNAEEPLPELTEETVSICKSEDIRVAFLKSNRVLYDISTQKEYTLTYNEYPGSADDAATYGEWYLY
ncbi:MAG: hypothetical protein E7406_01380 [Ruminococcaceae bacterium]|nr:hypothetical protein [Oscillospiraceae bacterium]